jgi:hypothetical protein
VLEGQAAAQQEGYEVVAPEVADFSSFFDKLTVAIDAITGQIGANVGTRGGTGGLRVARRRDLDQRARLRIARAEGGTPRPPLSAE